MQKLAAFVLVVLACAALSACTSAGTPQVLESAATPAPQPVGDISEPDVASALSEEPQPAAPNEALTQVSALAGSATIRIEPVVGAPESAVQAMSRRIASRTSERGMELVPPGAPGATHDMKGYFSAITEGGKTTVIFVWDVFDASGNRLHRIQGQETAPGTSPDGWSSVSASMMETIGVRTVDEFAAWLESRKQG